MSGQASSTIFGLACRLASSAKVKSALSVSAQDASAALPQNCQTTNWMVGPPRFAVNVTLVTHSFLLGHTRNDGKSNSPGTARPAFMFSGNLLQPVDGYFDAAQFGKQEPRFGAIAGRLQS
jgi:hypothetical protein